MTEKIFIDIRNESMNNKLSFMYYYFRVFVVKFHVPLYPTSSYIETCTAVNVETENNMMI